MHFHRTTSTEMHEDCKKLNVQGAHTLDPGLFNPRSSLFLFEDIEMYDCLEYERPKVESRL
jgi:hypothetical protein